jgi:fructoselysine-6-P-deglycase FrlB-like protein
LIEPANLIFDVSQSDESAEVVHLLDLTHAQVDLIGVTNSPGSAHAELASILILTSAGDEASVSCKIYIAALVTLTWLDDQLTGEYTNFPTLVDTQQKVDEYWSGWPGSVEVLRQRYSAMRTCTYWAGAARWQPRALGH